VTEANAMGTPGVVYPVPGLIESTWHDRTGLVCAEETPESLAESLKQCLRAPDKYQDYRHQALARARSLHWREILPKASLWFEVQARGHKE